MKKEQIRNQLQQLANQSNNSADFLAKAKEVLQMPHLSRAGAFYWCKKLGIKTSFTRGRPEKFN